MGPIAIGPFGHGHAILFRDAERRCLSMRGTRGFFERVFQFADAFDFRFELLAQKSILSHGDAGLSPAAPQFAGHVAKRLARAAADPRGPIGGGFSQQRASSCAEGSLKIGHQGIEVDVLERYTWPEAARAREAKSGPSHHWRARANLGIVSDD